MFSARVFFLGVFYCLFFCGNACASNWTTRGYDLNHSGYTPDYAPKAAYLLWNYTTEDIVYSSPVIVDDVVYVGSDDYNVYALNASNGHKIWNYSVGSNWVDGSPAVVNGIVYIGASSKYFYALNATTGAQVWNFSAGAYIYSAPAIHDGVVFFGTYLSGNPVGRMVYAFSATNGIQIWNYTTGDRIFSSPAVANGLVYIGSYDKKFYALNETTGAHVWNFTTGDWIYSGGTVHDGVVYVASRDNTTYALNATNGSQIWNFTTGWKVLVFPAVAYGLVFVNSMDKNMYALNESTGAQVWKFTCGDMTESSPAVADGMVFFGSYDYNLYALNASTGELVWNYTTGPRPGGGGNHGVLSSPAISNGLLVVGAYDHNVYAFSLMNATDFDGGTTNFVTADVANLSDLVIENTRYGKITFSEPVNLSGGADLNANINISYDSIGINSTALPELNKLAVLQLYNLTFANPRVLKDGSACSPTDCTITSYTGGILSFTITGFSTYSADETPATFVGIGSTPSPSPSPSATPSPSPNPSPSPKPSSSYSPSPSQKVSPNLSPIPSLSLSPAGGVSNSEGSEAAAAVSRASALLNRVQASGVDVSQAKQLLALAQQALNNGNYAAANSYASQAENVLNAKLAAVSGVVKSRAAGFDWFVVVGVVIVVLAVVGAYWFYYRKH